MTGPTASPASLRCMRLPAAHVLRLPACGAAMPLFRRWQVQFHKAGQLTGRDSSPHGPRAQATEALKITSPELINFGVMDEIIPEPLGGAHSDPMASFPYIKEAILNVYNNQCAPRSSSSQRCMRAPLPVRCQVGAAWPLELRMWGAGAHALVAGRPACGSKARALGPSCSAPTSRPGSAPGSQMPRMLQPSLGWAAGPRAMRS